MHRAFSMHGESGHTWIPGWTLQEEEGEAAGTATKKKKKKKACDAVMHGFWCQWREYSEYSAHKGSKLTRNDRAEGPQLKHGSPSIQPEISGWLSTWIFICFNDCSDQKKEKTRNVGGSRPAPRTFIEIHRKCKSQISSGGAAPKSAPTRNGSSLLWDPGIGQITSLHFLQLASESDNHALKCIHWAISNLGTRRSCIITPSNHLSNKHCMICRYM